MTTTGTRTTCKAITKGGQPCQSFTVTGSDFCIMHSPERAGAIAEARRRGGQARHGRKVGPVGDAEAVQLATVADVLDLLKRTADNLLALENSVSRGRAIIALATAWGTLWESSELERRLAALEAERENRGD
jgi:hypothetical protein